MKKQFLFLAVVLVSTTVAFKEHKNHVSINDAVQQVLDKSLDSFKSIFPGKPIGMGLYIKNTEEDIYVSSGFPKEYGDSIHFRGASTTKSFTAAAILRLHQEGKLNIDDIITSNIPGTNEPYVPATDAYNVPYKNTITIRQLLCHRAGVFDVTNSDIPDTVAAPYAGQRIIDYIKQTKGEDHTFSFEELINVVSKHQLSYFKPHEGFHYSNTGYNVLGVIIERVSGKRYYEFMQQNFLTPLKMEHTYFPYKGTDQHLPPPAVGSYLKINNELYDIDTDNVSSTVSEGNIVTTPKDLAKWGNALYGSNSILNISLQAQMETAIPTNEEHVAYGLGMEANPFDIGYGHGGARPGYMTIMRYYAPTKTTYVLFVNFMNFDPKEGLDPEAEKLYNVLREVIKLMR